MVMIGPVTLEPVTLEIDKRCCSSVADPSYCSLQIYFPTVYDIKYLMKFCDNLHGGLNKLAEVLQVDRIGPQHQVTNPTSIHSRHCADLRE